MKLSEIARLPSFALLGPGFSDGRMQVVAPLRSSAADPSIVYLPYEGDAASALKFSGERQFGVELDVPPVSLQIEMDESPHASAVAAIREAIAAGDVYQVNYTLRARIDAVPGEQLFATLCRREVPRFAAWVRLPDGTEFVSASPELFFQLDGRTIRSQPMKGTAPADGADALARSEKDAAELAMITDLVRNDLTPICEPRGVQVLHERRFIELPYAVQTVSDVAGTLLRDATLTDVLNALHPGGSITGAPKNAARKMIAKLEPERGAYCGTLGFIEGDRATFSLLIRTAQRTPLGWTYGVGGGIVWDSDAGRELEEVRVKLGALR